MLESPLSRGTRTPNTASSAGSTIPSRAGSIGSKDREGDREGDRDREGGMENTQEVK